MSGPGPYRRDDVVLPWMFVALCLGAEAVTGLLWIAQGVASLLTGRGWVVPEFRWGLGPVRDIAAAEPMVPRMPTLVVFGVLLVAAGFVVMQAASLVRRRVRARRRLEAAIAVNARAEVDGLTPRDRAAETSRLHPALTKPRPNEQAEVRDVLGVVVPSGPEVLLGWEDVELAVMAPRSGKTTARAIPRLLAAPGAAVGTANKPDLFRGTHLYRSKLGQVWRFDPQQVTHADQAFWWNPLRMVRGDESARQLAAQFVQAVTPNGGDQFWANSASDVLSSMFLAASTSGRSLRDVWRWLNSPTDDEPVRLLDDASMGSVAEGLRNMLFLHPETRDSVFQTARTGASCLRNPRVLEWVTPARRGLPEFDMLGFVRSTDTMYLMSKDTAGAAAPLLAGFLDQLFDVCQVEAERQGDRLAVPVTAVLDEVGNIAPWDRLPKVVSYSGSLGVSITAILQSWAQGERVWGRGGMEMLFGATTAKVIGSGIDDDTFAKRISLLAGQHDVPQRSTTHSGGGRSSTVSTHLRDVLPPDAVRALPKGMALVMFTGRRPVMVRLRPWHQSAYRGLVEESIEQARRELARRLGETGP